MNKYNLRDVSSKKEDVSNALKDKIDKGLYPSAFCKVVPDLLGEDKDYCNIMHSDGAGTKSSLAYIYYKETGDLSVFKNIAMDSLVMNIDDMICTGLTGNFLVSNTIDRNSTFIGGEVIKSLIHGFQEIIDRFNENGIKMILTGGETADVGDTVRTLIVNSTFTARMKKKDVITNENIKHGLVIIGLSSYGSSKFEEEYNSGIGSNGLTSARHDLFNKTYFSKYPESFNPDTSKNLIYSGKFSLQDTTPDMPINIGKACLSPTRSYIYIIKAVLEEFKDKISGMVHCTGGGQTKSIKFGNNVHYVKNNLFPIPPIFKLIKESSGSSFYEMYQVFNMGHRFEIYTDYKTAEKIIEISKLFGVDAQIIGEIKDSTGNKVSIYSPEGIIEYK